MTTPIALFVYNRPEHTRKTIKALQNNFLAKDSELFIFCDGPKNEAGLKKINEVHQIIDSVSGFKKVTITKRSLNKGLANSVIEAVSSIINQFGKIIVLEDDIVTSRYFLQYMNDGLEFYQNNPQIFAITGFNFPEKILKYPASYKEEIFFVKGRFSSWGWGSWKDRWNKIDFAVKDFESLKNDKKQQFAFNQGGDDLFDMLKLQMKGKIDAWDIQVSYAIFKNNAYTVFPIHSLVKNIGFDATGIHCSENQAMMDVDLDKTEYKKGTFKNPEEIKNNQIPAKIYINNHKRKFFQLSKAKKLRLKYILIGILISQAINFLYQIIK